MRLLKIKQFARWLATVIVQICFLISFYLVGVQLQQLFHLIVPGSLIGLVLLFTCLSLKIIPVSWVNLGASFLLLIMPLFFIPSMTGVMAYGSLFLHAGVFIVLDIVISAFVIFFVTGWAIQHLIVLWQKRSRNEVGK
ncbi:CidA/LrgA family protein [Brochothrix campestris]|uniref:Holin-like protein n=1 Tax=Brochothrix campestris FSL F6-1037 TaxID=1265861 RepID=W7CXK6_9LIST|nr:CidA/LrgA family holin-like protein [Brochothrix campestris]EUJ41712.1 hypothetical protein BCAMP_02465 [Brochothrix campestris FSL F6-1037]